MLHQIASHTCGAQKINILQKRSLLLNKHCTSPIESGQPTGPVAGSVDRAPETYWIDRVSGLLVGEARFQNVLALPVFAAAVCHVTSINLHPRTPSLVQVQRGIRWCMVRSRWRGNSPGPGRWGSKGRAEVSLWSMSFQRERRSLSLVAIQRRNGWCQGMERGMTMIPLPKIEWATTHILYYSLFAFYFIME